MTRASATPNVKTQNGPTWEAVFALLEAGQTVVGIDEVGRGAWAGPVTVAAVILPPYLELKGLNDSKLLTPARRLRLNQALRAQALAIGIGWASPAEIDQHGLTWAVRQAGLRALHTLNQSFDHIILDGNHNYLGDTHAVTVLPKADALVVPVAAASVIAKVARDRLMALMARRHPVYGFDQHKGYGTARHRAALQQHGPSPLHRLSWAPLNEY